MTLSTYTSYLIVTKDLNTSLNRVASDSQVKRETAYYEANIGNVTSVDEFMKDYRLYSYAMKAYGLEDMTYAKAFMRKILESDLTDSASFANKLTDKRYQEFASAFNFSGGTKVAQSGAQQSDVMDGYEASITANEAAINTETKYYDTAIDKITSVDGLVNNSRLMSYAMKAYGIYTNYYSKDKIKQLLTSDMSDPASFGNVEYVQKRATLIAQNDVLQATVDLVDEKSSNKNQINTINTRLAENVLDGRTVEEWEADRDALQARNADIDTGFVNAFGSSDDATMSAIYSKFNADIDENERLIGIIDGTLAMAAQFSFNPDGSLVNATAQTAQQKSDMKTTYLLNVSDGPSTTLFLVNKAHYEEVVANATTVDDLTNDARVVEYIRVAYGFSQYTSASTIRSMMLSDPTNSGSSAATKGVQDFPRYFNFNSDGTVKAGMTAQSNADITFTNAKGVEVTVNPLSDINSKYRKNYLTAHQDEIDLAMENYEKRIDAVKSLGDLMETNKSYWQNNPVTGQEYSTYGDKPELWQMAMEAYGIDSSQFSATKVRRILTSDLSDKTSYVYTLKDDNLVKFAKAFNFDAKGNVEAPVQAQSEGVVNELTSAYKSQKTRFLTGTELQTATKKAETEITYYKEQLARITTVDALLKDSRLVDVMLTSRDIDPKSVTTADLKKMFVSDLSDPKSYVNQQDNKDFAELVSSFNFDAKGKLTEDKSVLGEVQQRGDVLETVNRYVRQMLEEDQGNASEGVRLALYFQRKAPEITSAYSFLNDSALTQFFTSTFSLSTYFSNMDVTKQKAMVEKLVDVKKLEDPKYVRSLIQRYTAMFDSTNNNSSSAALTLLTS